MELRWADNITTDLEEIGCEVVDWIHLAQEWDLRWTVSQHGNGLLDSIK